MIRRSLKYSMAALLFVTALAVLAPAASAMTAKANHDDIKIGVTYHGSTVSVSGMSDPNVDLIMRITSEDSTEKLMRKDKKLGMWMNVEEIELDYVPEVYYMRSTKDLDAIVSPEQREKYVLGYPALEKKIEMSPAKTPEEKIKLLADFIKYKEEGKLYAVSTGDVDIKPDNASETYYTVFEWPYQAPPGNYQVDVYAVREGQVVDTAQSQVLVEKDGAVKTLSDMARNNGAVYGLAAIGVSVTAGFGVGIIFKSGGGSH